MENSPNVTSLLEILDQSGLFEFVRAKASESETIFLCRKQEVGLFRERVPHAIVKERIEDEANPGCTVIDCHSITTPKRPSIALSLFTDVVFCYLTGTDLSYKHEVQGPRYYILCTPRSGSTLLCDLLTATGQFGRPTEHLKPWLGDYLRASGLPFSELIAGLHRYGSTQNGVFGSKVIIDDLFALFRENKDAILDELARSTLLFLIRADKGLQAISNLRSHATGIYHVAEGEKAEKLSALSKFKPNMPDIFQMERWLLRQESDLLDLLAANNIYPEILSYEAFSQSRQGARTTLFELATALSVPFDGKFTWPSLVKISSYLSQREYLRYLTFRGATVLFSTRSEPWLGGVLRDGWACPEHWGVRTTAGEATIELPSQLQIEKIEMVLNIDELSPSSINIGDERIVLPENHRGSWSFVFQPTFARETPKTVRFLIPNGAMSLEELIVYEVESSPDATPGFGA
jgi:LPS sulfotransferase NodH